MRKLENAWTETATSAPVLIKGDASNGLNDEIWDERQVARYLKIAPKTLRQWRSQRSLLPFIKINNKLVRYRRTDVEEFVRVCVRRSTSDRGDM